LEQPEQTSVSNAAAPSVRFYLAGRLAVEGSVTLDQSDLPAAQGRRALVHLVLARHRPVPAEELADVLWGETPPASWETTLRAVVSKLRTALGLAGITHAVSTEGGCYQLRVSGAWV
jgi:DNA-binding SARP family transcriptional activator